MKPYDKWLSFKYLEHVADSYTLGLLKDKRELDKVTDELNLNMTMREIIVDHFRWKADTFKDYSGMQQHMLMLSEYVKNGQEDLAVKAIELKAQEMRQISSTADNPRWRR